MSYQHGSASILLAPKLTNRLRGRQVDAVAELIFWGRTRLSMGRGDAMHRPSFMRAMSFKRAPQLNLGATHGVAPTIEFWTALWVRQQHWDVGASGRPQMQRSA